MIRALVDACVRSRHVVLGLAAATVVGAAQLLQQMPVDVLPEFAPPTVEVQTEAIGLSSEEVADLVTLNLEELLAGVPWLASIRSASVTGLSTIVLTFDRGTDVAKARQMVQERLTLAYTLPNVAQPPTILQPRSAAGRLMMVAVSSSTMDAAELSLLVRWTVKPRLLGVPGVANVAIWGQRLPQLTVALDPGRLHDARVSQDDLIAATGDAMWVSPLTFLKGSSPGSGGWIDAPNQRLGISHAMPIASPADLAAVPITAQHLLLAGKAMAIGDIAEVTYTHAPLIGDAVLHGADGLLLVIEKLPGADVLEVTRGIDRALAELRGGLPGVTVDAGAYRLADYVEAARGGMTRALGLGVLAALVLVGVVLGWRAAALAGAAAGMSTIMALLALRALGATLNTMTLAGLCVGLAVAIDHAVGQADAIARRSRRGDDASAPTTVGEAARASGALGACTSLAFGLAVAPVFAMDGLSGAFFEPMALAACLALAASIVVSLTLVPALASFAFRDAVAPAKDARASTELEERYVTGLRRVAASRRVVIAAAALVIVSGVVAWGWVDHALLPALREPAVVVHWSAPPGTSHPETRRITARLVDELAALAGVRGVVAHIGRAVTGDQVVGIHDGQVWVALDPSADRERTLAAIQGAIDGYPGIDRSLHFQLRDTVAEALTGRPDAILVRVYGPQRAAVRAGADGVARALAGTPGLANVRAEGHAEELGIELRVDLEAASRENVKPGDVRRSASTVFGGLVAGFLFRDQKILDVAVWGVPEARRSVSDLRDLWIDRMDRHQTRLADVAAVRLVDVPTVIRRERNALYADVVASVDARDLAEATRVAENRVHEVALPQETHAAVLGEDVERERAQRRLLVAAAMALAGILLLLHAYLGTWRLAAMALAALPVAVGGGVLATLASGGAMSLGSLVGLLAVLGIASRHATCIAEVLVTAPGAGPPAGGTMAAADRVARVALRPILAGASAIVALLAPAIVAGQGAGLEILHATAIVLAGGTLASVLYALVVLPVAWLQATPPAKAAGRGGGQ